MIKENFRFRIWSMLSGIATVTGHMYLYRSTNTKIVARSMTKMQRGVIYDLSILQYIGLQRVHDYNK